MTPKSVIALVGARVALLLKSTKALMCRTTGKINRSLALSRARINSRPPFAKICFLIAAWLISSVAFAAPPTISPLQEQPNENNLRLLNIRVGSYVMEGLLGAYSEGNMVLIPLTALAEIVDLGVEVRIGEGTAEGFLYHSDRTFYLDVKRSEIVLSGKTNKFDGQRVKIYPDDIYVDSQLLSQWMPFKLDVNLFASQIKIMSSEKLPFEQRMERERRLKNAQAHRRDPDPGFPRHYEPYRQWRVPFINQTIDVRATRDGASGTTSGSFAYTTYATGELFKMESSLYLSGSQQNILDTARLTFSRSDPSGRLLGGLNARQYSFGHVNAPATESITRPQAPSLGVYISNRPLYRQNQYDKHTFRGDLMPGWEVELYQNNALIGLKRPDASGQYNFEDVPLFFGRNYFRLVFYGPQGQKREINQNFNINDALVKSGQHQFTGFTGQDVDGGVRGTLQYSYGVAKILNVGAGLDYITLSSTELLGGSPESYLYARTGAQMLLAGSFVTANVISASNGGMATDLGWQMRIGQFGSLSLKSVLLDNFVSERFPLLADPTQNYSEGTFNTAIPQSFVPRIPLQFKWSRFGYASGAERVELTNRISIASHRLSFSNNLSLVSQTSQQDIQSGQIQLSRHGRRASFRADVNYTFSPTSEITSAGFTADQIRYKGVVLSISGTRLLSLGYDQYTFNINRPKGKFGYTIGTSYSTNGNASISFRLTFGLGQEPRTQDWKMSADHIAGRGAVSARVFIDHDGDGVYTAGDEPLQGAKFRINGTVSKVKTDKQGIAFLTGLQPHNATDIGLATESLEDPTWTPTLQGVRLTPRPGEVAQIDFPVIETGEIDGTVYFRRGRRHTAAGNVTLELVNAEGNVVAETKSAFDGFYVFTVVPDGIYLVRVSPAQIKELGLSRVAALQVRVSRLNQFVSGINFAVASTAN